MHSDEAIYIDPEEDEVFFGNITEKEKSIYAKLVNIAGSLQIFGKEGSVENQESHGDANNETSLCNERPYTTNSKKEDKITSNTSVELDHNYSTPSKQKIDKAILSTPKSIVKADKDGGFLKVLSEIALVKAEAEADDVKKDEDKENRIIPEIIITKATPENSTIISPSKKINSQLRRFRIIYNSPKNENLEKFNSKSEKFENYQNIKVKHVNQGEPLHKVLNDSINLISLNKSALEQINSTDSDITVIKNNNFEKVDTTCKNTENTVSANPVKAKIIDDPVITELQNQQPEIHISKTPVENMRFSQEAKKIIEFLKKSVSDDNLNFTIPEIDVNNLENSFLYPDSVPNLDVTVNNNISDSVNLETPHLVSQPVKKKPIRVVNTIEKERQKMTPIISRSKMGHPKYFSERKIHNQTNSTGKGCVKKLEMEETMKTKDKKNCKEISSMNGSSKIPVFGVKCSRLHVNSKTTPLKTSSQSSEKSSKFKNIESPISAYIHNKPTYLVVNVKPELKKNALKPSKVLPPSSKQVTSKPQNPTAEIQLPFVEYKSGTPLKVEKRPESRLPRLAPGVQKLLGTHSPKVIKHIGRFCMNTPQKGVSANDGTIVAGVNEVSLLVCKTAQKSNPK